MKGGTNRGTRAGCEGCLQASAIHCRRAARYSRKGASEGRPREGRTKKEKKGKKEKTAAEEEEAEPRKKKKRKKKLILNLSTEMRLLAKRSDLLQRRSGNRRQRKRQLRPRPTHIHRPDLLYLGLCVDSIYLLFGRRKTMTVGSYNFGSFI